MGRPTPWSKVLPEKLTVPQLVIKFPTFYATQRFVTIFTHAHHFSLSCVKLIWSITSHPLSLKFILILSSYLYISLPSGLLPYSVPTKTLYAVTFSPTYVTCPSQLIPIYIL
jgi:hypothetical protein